MSSPEEVHSDSSPLQTARHINGLRVVRRTIVSAYIHTVDDYLLMGRQDPSKGRAFPNAWRIPGGGVKVDENNMPLESLEDAMVREGNEEVIGLNLTRSMLTPLEATRTIGVERTLPSGEVIFQLMVLRHFGVPLDQPVAQYAFSPGSDLIELSWPSRAERETIELIRTGRELMREVGHLDPLS